MTGVLSRGDWAARRKRYSCGVELWLSLSAILAFRSLAPFAQSLGLSQNNFFLYLKIVLRQPEDPDTMFPNKKS